VLRSAVVSPCGTYRYELRRRWSEAATVGWVMLNPSIADGAVDDPTIRRCVDFAQRWKFGAIVVRNLYALRATDPREIRSHPAPLGPDNLAHLRAAGDDALTICAWGCHGALGGWGSEIRTLLVGCGANPHHLGLTTGGQPRHPLYLKASTTPTPW
jgi:hypothetical protein